MFNRREITRPVPASSMADIAFLLLIFFMVTTTIVDESGILVRLPTWNPEAPIMQLKDQNVLSIYLNKFDQLMVEERIIDADALPEVVRQFILNPSKSPTLSTSPKKAVISIKNDRGSSYHKYIDVYDGIVKCFARLYDDKARERYGHSFTSCTEDEKSALKTAYAMIISELEAESEVLNGELP